MVREIVFSSRADRDFASITEYLENDWSVKQIRNFNSILDDKLRIIKRYPYIYPSVSKNKIIRKCVLIEQISLFYQIKISEIIILTLFDSRQNPDNLKL